MAEVEAKLPRQEAMTSLVMEKSYNLQENCQSTTYPEVKLRPKRPESMPSLAMEKSFNLQENSKSPTYPEVQFRQKSPADTSETQRKKRARNRLSNRRSTGFVFEDDVKAAWEMGAEASSSSTTSNH